MKHLSGKNAVGVAAGLSRRALLVGLPAFVAACQSVDFPSGGVPLFQEAFPRLGGVYGPVFGEPFPVPAVNLSYVDPAYYRTRVPLPTHIDANQGEIVVDADTKYLYFVEDDRWSTRYGVGVGREGFGWSGQAAIRRKAEWPTWTPPPQMVRRDPNARQWASGMPGGPGNPLGARALYLYQGSRDTLYRIHGTVEPWTIGTNVSSGCIRMINQDVIHLYGRVPIGTRVRVLA